MLTNTRSISKPLIYNIKYLDYLIGFLGLVLYLSPNIFFQSTAKYLIHDNLDGLVPTFKRLAESGQLFSNGNEIAGQVMGGIPRKFLPSEMNLIPILHFIFPTLIAYNLNIILIHIIAYLGALLLMKDFIIKSDKEPIFTSLLSLSFALIPFWPHGGITIAGLPLVIWALLNLYLKKRKTISWFIVTIFPFYSSLVLGNLFFYFFLFLTCLFLCIKKRKIIPHIVIPVVLLSILSVVAEYRLFLIQFFDKVQNHRQTWSAHSLINIKGVLGISTLLFLKGHYHFFSRYFPIAPIVSIIGIWMSPGKMRKYLILLIILAGFFAFASVFRDHNYFGENWKILHVINPRFYSLLPVLWFIILGISLKSIILWDKKTKIPVLGILTLLSLSHFFNFFKNDYHGSDYLENSFYFSFLERNNDNYGTFNEFFKISQFEKIKNKLPEVKNILCFGFLPDIAQYNGYNTLGGYLSFYPLSTCLNLGKIKGTQDINCPNRYLFDFEDLKNPHFSFLHVKKLKTTHVFSSKPIQHKYLKFIDKVDENSSPIFIYEII